MECSKCSRVAIQADWPIIGGERDGGCVTGGERTCPACAAREIERLQAIVDKLPKTADGVPVVPRMKVWHIESEAWHKVTAIRPVGNDWQFDDFYGVFASDCYSIREAAEAAKGRM